MQKPLSSVMQNIEQVVQRATQAHDSLYKVSTEFTILHNGNKDGRYTATEPTFLEQLRILPHLFWMHSCVTFSPERQRIDQSEISIRSFVSM